MASAMRRELISGTYIQADETPVDVQMHEGRGKNHQAYLWQYSRPGGTVVFDFRLGRGRYGDGDAKPQTREGPKSDRPTSSVPHNFSFAADSQEL